MPTVVDPLSTLSSLQNWHSTLPSPSANLPFSHGVQEERRRRRSCPLRMQCTLSDRRLHACRARKASRGTRFLAVEALRALLALVKAYSSCGSEATAQARAIIHGSW